MAYVITKLCADCKDLSCTLVCPVDCIYEYSGNDADIPTNMLFIDPDECIDCDVCVPECPWEAIFEADSVPEVFTDCIELNSRIVNQPRFVPDKADVPVPTAEEIQANKAKWGYAG